MLNHLQEKIDSFYTIIKRINENCHSERLIYFFRVHAYQAALEAILSFYLVQLWLLFTPFFSPEPITEEGNGKFLAFVITSLAITSIIYMVYMIILIKDFIICINENIGKEYNVVDEKIKETSKTVHKRGVKSYIIVGALTGIVLRIIASPSSLTCEYLIMSIFIVEFLAVVGFVCGGAWNYQDYYADRRINWCSFYKDLKHECAVDEIDKPLFRYTFIHGLCGIIGIIAIIILLVALVLVVGKNPSHAKQLLDGDFIQNAYVLLFFAILILYAKTVFSLYYQKNNKGFSLYPEIAKFGIGKEADVENEAGSVTTIVINNANSLGTDDD